MIRRGIALALVLVVSSAVSSRSEAVAIDHKAVGCIVVGKYPKMNACFTPNADVARSRVYFRPEGVASWYYVDMKSDQPCFAGTLPKPGKKLVGKKIEYYVEAQDRGFNAARTAEYAPIVVRSAQECKKEAPAASARARSSAWPRPARRRRERRLWSAAERTRPPPWPPRPPPRPPPPWPATRRPRLPRRRPRPRTIRRSPC